MIKLHFIMSHLQTRYHFQLFFQQLDEDAGDKWLINATKHHKGIQSHSLELLNPIVENSSRKSNTA